jgi:anti-sigma B factor antagonist
VPAGRPLDPDWPAPRGRRLSLAAATRADLAAVRAHVERECRHACDGAEPCEALALAADEVCANVLEHAYAGSPGPITVDVRPARPAAPGCTVVVADAGPPFDPTTAAASNARPPSGPAEDRRPGGFGWMLVRASVDHLRYERAGGCNVVTLERRCAPPAPAAPNPNPPMEISIAQEDQVTVVTVSGSLDALTADALDDALQAQVRDGRTRLVASFAALEYTSSAGLRVLLGAMKAARQRGGDLRVAGAQPRVERVLALSGFTGILRCFPDVPSAVASWAP